MKQPSAIFLNAQKKAKEANVMFDRLERTIKHNGTLAHFFTKVEGEKSVYHYGYHSIFEAIQTQQNKIDGIVEDEEIFDDEEYDFEQEFADEVFEAEEVEEVFVERVIVQENPKLMKYEPRG
jgi:hypothetical protein